MLCILDLNYCNISRMLLYVSLFAVLCSLCASQLQDTCPGPQSSCLGQLPKSCEEIRVHSPFLSSGYYSIADKNGNRQRVYCEMDTICGGCGWTRLGKLDMTEPGSECPKDLRLYKDENGEIRACGKQASDAGGCSSVMIPSLGVKYTEVCGRVIGYQFKTPAAFHVPDFFVNDIDTFYVDGVSITHGTPRQHIWTLANSWRDSYDDIRHLCPCTTLTTTQIT